MRIGIISGVIGLFVTLSVHAQKSDSIKSMLLPDVVVSFFQLRPDLTYISYPVAFDTLFHASDMLLPERFAVLTVTFAGSVQVTTCAGLLYCITLSLT